MGQMCLADTKTPTPPQSTQAKPQVVVIWNTDPSEFPSDPLTELAKAVQQNPEVRLFHVGEESNFGGYHDDGYWYDRFSQRLRYSAFSWREYGNEHEQALWSQVTPAKLADLTQQPPDFDEVMLKRVGCKKIGHWYHKDNDQLYKAPSNADLNQRLLAAVSSGNLASVKTLIAQGANVNKSQEDFSDRTPIMEAAFNAGGHNMTPIVRILLKHGADVNAQDKNGLTPLMLVTNIASAHLLLAKKPHLNLRDDHRRTALLWAISHEVPALVKAFLDQGANANEMDKVGQTALISAANAKNGAQIIPLLLAKGAPVDRQDANGDTALIFAANEHLTANVRSLLRAGADVNTRNALGETALVAASHDLPTLRILLQHGANPNLADKDGNTPMIDAISAPDALAIVSFLVAHGAKINAQNQAGQTALMVAAGDQNTALMTRLLALGADPNIQDKEGATALFDATTVTYSISLNKFIHPGTTKEFIQTPFSPTALEAVRVLLAHGAKMNVRDKKGRTILSYAKSEKNTQLVVELEKIGVQE